MTTITVDLPRFQRELDDIVWKNLWVKPPPPDAVPVLKTTVPIWINHVALAEGEYTTRQVATHIGLKFHTGRFIRVSRDLPDIFTIRSVERG